jgi:diguanylate cyclase (GGDEF)-like protein
VAPGQPFYGEALPVYRTASPPATVAARRRALIGWVTISVDPKILLRDALAGAPGLRLRLRTTIGNLVTFSAGAPRSGSATTRIELADGSIASVQGSSSGPSILAHTSSMAILLGSGSVSILIPLIVFLLATGRARARRLVGEKTTELTFQAMHDHLTGLPNRVLVMDRIGQALARSGRERTAPSLLFVDIDGFKTVNDTYGHGAGDQLLKTVAARLAGTVREADTVGRFGGDEFIVLLERGDRPPAELVAQRILQVMSRPVPIEAGTEVRLSVSIGIALEARQSVEQLLHDADLALYAAKEAGRNCYVTYVPEMQATLESRRSLEIDLRSAIANSELSLVYQPVVRLEDGTLLGVEALLRWRHPERGNVPPDRFIPIAEESTQIIEIGRWVAREACRQAAAWQRAGHRIVTGINVSGRQLDDECFTDDIGAALARSGLDPGLLVLEITETSLMRDPRAATARLERLKRLGVQIAIDDFGTGYSSLSHLRQFPVDALKIDASFIAAIGTSPDAEALVNTLVQLGKTLHLSTLGEGIETDSQLRVLREAGCELGQGFLFARPLAAERLDQMLDDGSLQSVHDSGRIADWAGHLRAGGAADFRGADGMMP